MILTDLVLLLLLSNLDPFGLVLANYNNEYQAQHAIRSNQLQSLPGQCCACDEAKYELVFEGLWSKYTHPDDFPENYWLAAFGDIIGASHSSKFKMWEPQQLASDGVKDLAETGSTKKLEAELKQVSSKTRTIIKARELHYPTLNSKTSAVFRTDRQHHLVSILSKLSPSPDWMVGVSNLELCQLDCHWSAQKLVYLYIWDAGTDSGVNFTSPDSPSHPQEPIHPFRKQQQQTQQATGELQDSSQGLQTGGDLMYQSGNNVSYYNDQPMPAYDPRRVPSSESFVGSVVVTSPDVIQSPPGEQSKPFARLTITRQRIYEKSCSSSPSDQLQTSSWPPQVTISNIQNNLQSSTQQFAQTAMDPIPQRECRFTEWSDWTSCSSQCGYGLRTRKRSLKDDRLIGTECQSKLSETEVCISECVNKTNCVTTNWSAWSSCSVSCGQGRMKRTRSLIGHRRPTCGHIELVQWTACDGADLNGPECSSDQSPSESGSVCQVSEWSKWSECSNPCGKGTRTRMRQYLSRESVHRCKVKLVQKQNCSENLPSCKTTSKDTADKCLQPASGGGCYASLQRWYYNHTLGICMTFLYGGCAGNKNNFECYQDCEENCLIPMKSFILDKANAESH